MLMRLDMESDDTSEVDERWQRAMNALRDAIRVIGSKEYVRFGIRDSFDGEWTTVSIDLAKA